MKLLERLGSDSLESKELPALYKLQSEVIEQGVDPATRLNSHLTAISEEINRKHRSAILKQELEAANEKFKQESHQRDLKEKENGLYSKLAMVVALFGALLGLLPWLFPRSTEAVHETSLSRAAASLRSPSATKQP